jgi:hypothetical protein
VCEINTKRKRRKRENEGFSGLFLRVSFLEWPEGGGKGGKEKKAPFLFMLIFVLFTKKKKKSHSIFSFFFFRCSGPRIGSSNFPSMNPLIVKNPRPFLLS